MQTGFLQSINFVLAVVALTLCLVPLAIVLWRRQEQQKAYVATSLYWLLNGFIALLSVVDTQKARTLYNQITLGYNLFDALFVLLIFFFAAPPPRKKIMRIMIFVFVAYETIILCLKGYGWESITYITGVGGALVLAMCVTAILQYIKTIEHRNSETAMIFVFAGYLFLYGFFIVIFIFNYVNFNEKTVDLIMLLYLMSVIAATTITNYGLWRFARKDEENAYRNFPDFGDRLPVHAGRAPGRRGMP